jgi:hypothetical protein
MTSRNHSPYTPLPAVGGGPFLRGLHHAKRQTHLPNRFDRRWFGKLEAKFMPGAKDSFFLWSKRNVLELLSQSAEIVLMPEEDESSVLLA